jgi:flavodoxin
MKVLIVHDSKHGCGKAIADQIAKGLTSGGHDANVIHVSDLKSMDIGSYDAFVIGSPTHVGGPTFKVGRGIKLLGKGASGKPFTTFTTWMDEKQRTLEKIEAKALKVGLRKLMDGKAYKVKGIKGPLEDSCPAEAEEFGKQIGEALK